MTLAQGHSLIHSAQKSCDETKYVNTSHNDKHTLFMFASAKFLPHSHLCQSTVSSTPPLQVYFLW